MHRNILETVMGAIVIVVAGWFFYTAYKGRDVGSQVQDAYHASALFDNATGVSAGSDVRVGGVKIGVVDTMALDPKSYRAKVNLLLSKKTPIPDDSSASIVGDGLLGSKFVSITPGASDDMLKDQGTIEYTQSSVSLEELIGKFVFSAGGVDKEEDDSGDKTNESPAAEKTEAAPEKKSGDDLDLSTP
ncbi:MAG: outer membrane lipid asymmetry maintenance protein MlaD [Rickettsiales bacterium]